MATPDMLIKGLILTNHFALKKRGQFSEFGIFKLFPQILNEFIY